MKYYILILIVAFMVAACGDAPSAAQPTKAPEPTAPEPTVVAATAVVSEPFGPIPAPAQTQTQTQTHEEVNEMVGMKSEIFTSEIRKIIGMVFIYEPEIGDYLSRCEIGIANQEGYAVERHGDGATCIVLFVSDSMAKIGQLKQLAKPENISDPFVLAMTQDIFDLKYPVIFVTEYEVDRWSWVRVIAHEGFHVMSIKKGTDTRPEEEADAFTVQFKILEKMYGEEKVSIGPEAYKLPSPNAWYDRYLGMEAYVYKAYKSGKLIQELAQMGYGDR